MTHNVCQKTDECRVTINRHVALKRAETRKGQSRNITGNTCFRRKQVVVNVAIIWVFGCGNQTETNKLVRLRRIRKNGNTRKLRVYAKETHVVRNGNMCKIHVNVMKTIPETSIFALCLGVSQLT